MEIEVSSDKGVVTVRCDGALDAATAPAFKAAVEPHTGSDAARIVVDGSALEFIDSTGLGVLIALQRRMRAVAGCLVLAALTEDVQAIFTVTRLDRVFSVFSTLKEACQYAANHTN